MPGKKNDGTSYIGAFCTDIVESVDRIDKYGKKGLTHHSAYIRTAAEDYIRQLKESNMIKGKSLRSFFNGSDFWIPGDALWGLIAHYPEDNSGKEFSIHDSIVRAFTFTLRAFANGLIEAHKMAKELGIECLKIRGAVIGGEVLIEDLKGTGVRILNGSSLNVCGRLQGQLAPNSILLGFIVPDDPNNEAKGIAKMNLGIPEIKYSEICEHFHSPKSQRYWHTSPGCNFELDVAESKNGEKFIRLLSLSEKIRGMQNCRILKTEIKYQIDTNMKGINLGFQKKGEYSRDTVGIQGKSNKILLDNLVSQNGKDFFVLPNLYKDKVEINIPSNGHDSFTLVYKGNTNRPMAGSQRKKKKTINFAHDHYGIIPIYNAYLSRETILLIRNGSNTGEKSLKIYEAPYAVLADYPDLNLFDDNAFKCVKYIFK